MRPRAPYLATTLALVSPVRKPARRSGGIDETDRT